MDWLRRVYQFGSDEIDLAFDNGGFLSLEQDPKTVIAMENLDAFPMDLNSVAKDQLLRIPGIGPISADRIMQNRRLHSIDNWRDLQAMGVVQKRAWPYVVFPGQRPPSGKQLRLDLFGEAQDRRTAEAAGLTLPPPTSPLLAAAIDVAPSAGETAHACIPGSKGAMCAGLPGEPGNSMNRRVISPGAFSPGRPGPCGMIGDADHSPCHRRPLPREELLFLRVSLPRISGRRGRQVPFATPHLPQLVVRTHHRQRAVQTLF